MSNFQGGEGGLRVLAVSCLLFNPFFLVTNWFPLLQGWRRRGRAGKVSLDCDSLLWLESPLIVADTGVESRPCWHYLVFCFWVLVPLLPGR